MILKGEKVILRPIKLIDAPVFVKWFNDPEVNKFLSVRQMKLSDEQKWIKARLKGKTENSLFFCIETAEGKLIGNTAFEAISKQDRRASFGIVIGEKDYWSKGYGSDAARTIINYGFKKLKLHRIFLDVYEYNPRAMKVYKRLGFKKEGIKREHVRLGNKYFDAYNMSILDREWKQKN